jgi:enamine deaminase RidA (YjgF/YER057c/UK114 family)
MQRRNISTGGKWEPVGRVHGEYFGEIRPATAMVEVSRLLAPDMLIEIEADAVVGGSRSGHAR